MMISMVTGLTALASVAYLRFLFRCLVAWRFPSADSSSHDFPSVTVVVPARNEAEKILRTLQAIDMQSVPVGKVETVVVDDHSEDDTARVVMGFMAGINKLPIRLISLENSYSKKAAITAAVNSSAAEWIVTIDADVIIRSNMWLSGLMDNATEDVQLICGPVLMEHSKGDVFGKIARLESLGLLMIAGSHVISKKPLFCNGANMAFRRSGFTDTAGFDRERLTGDDTDLLHLFPPVSIRFSTSQETLVTTEPPGSIGGFFSQRQRWASKIPRAQADRLLSIGLMAWFTHAGILGLFICSWFDPHVFWILLAGVLFKSVMEYSVLNTSAIRYGEKVSWQLILLFQPIYCLSITLIGIAAVFLPYRWKGRID